jgi:hypothetical protein
VKQLCSMLVFFLIVVVQASDAWALGEESFGNEPLNEANFDAFLGIVPLVNDEQRVYRTWVNGNEHFYYGGSVEQLNAFLRKFAKTPGKVREVILRPGVGVTQTFSRDRKIKFNWNLHLVGGIAASMSKADKGDLVWSPNPTVTVYVDKEMDLDKLRIPEGVTLAELSDLAKRYGPALTSTDQNVRGWSTGHLARLDPYNLENLARVAKQLDDKNDWVRLNAAGAIKVFGPRAKPYIPTLRKCAESDDKQLATRAQEAIDEIASAKDDTEAQKEQKEALERIRRFCAMRPKKE